MKAVFKVKIQHKKRAEMCECCFKKTYQLVSVQCNQHIVKYCVGCIESLNEKISAIIISNRKEGE